jgi:FtsP/CotA-like multicopper oxidase with cupredoxin domain
MPSFTFTKGKRYKLRLANVGGDATQKFSIDGHKLLVVSTDFTQIEPWETDRVTLGVGQRADVIVTANGDESSAYWMRTDVAWCSLSLSYASHGVIFYNKADRNKKPTSKSNPDNGFWCAGDPLKHTKPFYQIDADENPSTTIKFTNFYTINATGHLTFTMDFPYTFRGNYSTPLLREVNRENPVSRWKQLYDFGTNSTIRVVINNPTIAQNAHAVHFHGHDMQVLAEGAGNWDGKTLNLKNPVRRDTQVVIPDGHIVFQYKNDNPGIWPMHCHIPWHVADGLVVNLMEDSAKLRQLEGMEQFMEGTCKEWTEWAKTQDLQDQN